MQVGRNQKRDQIHIYSRISFYSCFLPRQTSSYRDKALSFYTEMLNFLKSSITDKETTASGFQLRIQREAL